MQPYSAHDFGAVGDGVTPDDAAFTSMFQAILKANGLTNSGASVVLADAKTYYFEDNLVITQNINMYGATAASFSDNTCTRLKFAPGKGIWVRGICGSDQPSAVGARMANLAVAAQQLSGIQPYRHGGAAWKVGELMYLPHLHEHVL